MPSSLMSVMNAAWGSARKSAQPVALTEPPSNTRAVRRIGEGYTPVSECTLRILEASSSRSWIRRGLKGPLSL